SVQPQVLLHDVEHFLGGGELHRDAIGEVADDAGAHAAQRDRRAHCRTNGQFDGCARERDVDDLTVVPTAIVEDDGGVPVVRHDAFVATVLGEIENVLVGQPGQ